MDKDKLITMLQDEVIFLQTTDLTDKQIYKYHFKMDGDLSCSRWFQ